jgi:hypothetical protein
VIHAHLGYSIVAIQKELMGFVSPIKELSERSIPVIDYTHYINEVMLCLGSNDVDLVSEKVLKQSLETK